MSKHADSMTFVDDMSAVSVSSSRNTNHRSSHARLLAVVHSPRAQQVNGRQAESGQLLPRDRVRAAAPQVILYSLSFIHLRTGNRPEAYPIY